MTHAHNTFLRNLNATLLQGPHIADPSTSPTYNLSDITDLLFFVAAWLKMLNHHHHVEEIVLFFLLAAVPGMPAGYLDAPLEQHQAFHDGLAELQVFCAKHLAEPAGSRWSEMERIIHAFAPALLRHLGDEIGVLLGLEALCDSGAVMRC